jgi:hypothetical protein
MAAESITGHQNSGKGGTGMNHRIFKITALLGMMIFLWTLFVPGPSEAGSVVSVYRMVFSAVKRLAFSNIEKELLNTGSRAVVNGRKVVKRSDLFSSRTVDALGRSSLERMRRGLAPIGKVGFPMELHHMQQKSEGAILELTRTIHHDHSGQLHRYTRKSEIDRIDFGLRKKDYWKTRAEDF